MPKKYNQEDFLKKIEEVHGNSIDVSEFIYTASTCKGKAKCNICGHIWYPRADVLIRGCGCRKCYDKRNSESRKESISDVQKKIKETITIIPEYYIDSKHYAKLKCNICGNVCETKVQDLKGCKHGCPKCALKKQKERYLNTLIDRINNFKTKVIKKFGNKYDLSEIDKTYINNRSKATIICPVHGKISIIPNRFLMNNGCPMCNESNLEREIRVFFEEKQIKKEMYYNSFEWLKTNKGGILSFDFYLPDYNIAIECQGKQHYEDVDIFSEKLEERLERDILKFNLCKENNVKILYYTDYKGEIPEIYKKFTYYNKDKLLEEIIKR